MPENDPQYYHARAAHARELAEKAKTMRVNAIHLEMARNYDLLAEDATDRLDAARDNSRLI